MRLTTSQARLNATAWLSDTWASVLAAGALLLVFAADRATGSTPVQHLYYLPIILAGRRFGTAGSIASALSAIALYHLANPHLLTFRYEESDIVQMTLFVAVGVITARLTLDADRLRQLALTDDLTGLHNLRSFEAHLARLVRASRASHASLTLLVLDVDRLKALNDQYGHLTGAEAVRTVGRIIAERIAPDAVGCRYGGDEFVIALPDSTPALTRRVADDLCRAVHDSAPLLAGRPFGQGTLSISVGGACVSFDRSPVPPVSAHDGEVGESLFRAADDALYRAKTGGRNQVCLT